MTTSKRGKGVDNLSAITGIEDEEIDEDLEVHEVESDSGEDFFI